MSFKIRSKIIAVDFTHFSVKSKGAMSSIAKLTPVTLLITALCSRVFLSLISNGYWALYFMLSSGKSWLGKDDWWRQSEKGGEKKKKEVETPNRVVGKVFWRRAGRWPRGSQFCHANPRCGGAGGSHADNGAGASKSARSLAGRPRLHGEGWPGAVALTAAGSRPQARRKPTACGRRQGRGWGQRRGLPVSSLMEVRGRIGLSWMRCSHFLLGTKSDIRVVLFVW